MKKELLVTRVSIALTLVALFLVYRDVVIASAGGDGSTVDILQGATFAVLITALVYGSLVYLIARDGYLRRRASCSQRCMPELEDEYLERDDLPGLSVLIPSFKEEPRVVRQTILSAALCIYGRRRVVVLIDDPCDTAGPELEALRRTRTLVTELNRRFEEAAAHVRRQQAASAADLYDFAAQFVASLARVAAPAAADRADDFLLARIIAPCAARYRERAQALRCTPCDPERAQRERRRLLAQLSVEIASFERKRFHNLSHAPNKAMNLNSYIGLLGKSLRIVRSEGLLALQECPASVAELAVPDASYLLTLDADSMVLPDYLLKLVDIMEREPNIAVAQTPYSAIPGSANWLERAAGAQTDLQYFIHQGSTAADATFWVGANALLRVGALRTIATVAAERGSIVPVYIQDRTVIEDTGSTLDLIRRGWTLHNHPERLAYSATPPDFGSLIIQRRRWSNGGLIIFPDLVRYALARLRSRPPSPRELLLRTHYLCGPALTGFSVLLLLALPFSGELLSAWLPATVIPYYALYAHDAREVRYGWLDVVSVYVLNLMLLPITLAGVLRSVQQAVTGRKGAFGRTPKTEQRTSVPRVHLLLQIGLLCMVAAVMWRAAANGQFFFAAFSAVNFFLLAAGFAIFIGVKAAWRDIAGHSKASSDAGATRIPGLDGIRAYAVTLVFLVHFFSQYFNGVTGSRRIDFDAGAAAQAGGLAETLARYFWASHYGVDLFFLLSGFFILRIVARQGFSYWHFVRSRFLRLYPAFLLALVVHLLYMSESWGKLFDAGTIAANALLLHGIWELKIQPIIVPTWSLAYEWLFYLAFPAVLLLPNARARISYAHLALCALLVLVLALVGAHYMRFLMFLSGAALAITPPAALKKLVAQIPDVGVLGLYIAVNLLFVADQNWYHFTPLYLFTSLVLVAKAVYGTGFLNKMLCLEALRRIGQISYSFYLFHGLVIIGFCEHVAPHLRHLPEELRFIMLLGGSFALSIAAAALSYFLVERPYFQRSWRPRGNAKLYRPAT